MKYPSLCLKISLLGTFLFFSCGNNSKTGADKPIVNKFELTEVQAKSIMDLPAHCLTVEYPNKLGQALGSDADLKPPRMLHPIFYGCYDWHSSVHGYWSIVKLMKAFPELDADHRIRATLDAHITDEHAVTEMAFFNDPNNLGFERTYGWAWLFKLQEELITWGDPDAERWSDSLAPLVELLSNRLISYLPNLVYPVRHGKHENTAFGLSLMLDYAKAAKKPVLEDAIVSHAKRLFEGDANCDISYEPSGSDFLSPCLEEAHLMSKVLDEAGYRIWLKRFMPSLFSGKYILEPAVVKDRTDGQLIHLDGLNYSRAACLYGISHKLPELRHVRSIADDHISFSLPNLSKDDDYMGAHWLGTFVLYALTLQ